MLMGYGLVDMFLLGRVGSFAVAASGAAGMYMWLGGGIMLVGRMGAEIGVAQSKGKRDNAEAIRYSHNSLFLAAVLAAVFTIACVFFAGPLIAFLNIQEEHVSTAARDYLAIVGLGIPAIFIASAISGIFTGAGNSRAPFAINAFGLVLNAVLDPIFIFTLGMGVRGAAVATTLSQMLACFLSLYWLLAKKDRPLDGLRLLVKPCVRHIKQILRWTVPVSVENILFTFFAMIVARQIAAFGADAITVYRVGSQAESLCWLICLGFSSGITAFVGQNFGAGRWTRIWQGFRIALAMIFTWGVLVTVLFFTCGRWLTGLFVPEEHIIEMGGTYLRILAFCQVFFCLESIAGGAFRGMGRTTPPSIASVVSNALRIPIVHVLTGTELGLSGVWWGIMLTATLRGLWVFVWFLLYARNKPKHDAHTGDSIRTTASSAVPSVRILP